MTNSETLRVPITRATGARLPSQKRALNVAIYDAPLALSTSSYWTGGARDVYDVLDLATGHRTPAPGGVYPLFRATHQLAAGQVLIKTGTHNGAPATPKISFLRCDLARVEAFFRLAIPTRPIPTPTGWTTTA